MAGNAQDPAPGDVPDPWRSPAPPPPASPQPLRFDPAARPAGGDPAREPWQWRDTRHAGITVLAVAGLLGSMAAVAVFFGANRLGVATGLLVAAIVALGFGSIAAVTHGKQLVRRGPHDRPIGFAVAGFVMGWVGLALVVFDIAVLAALMSLLGGTG